MANRFDYRRRSLSDDSYDHIRRGRFQEDLRRSRRRSFDRDIYSRVSRRRSPSPPDDIYSRPRRHSIDGPPSDYFIRRRRYSDDDGNFRRNSDDYSRYGRVTRRYSYEGRLPESYGRMRRFYSDPYLTYGSYGRYGHYGHLGRSVVPVGGVRSGYTVYTQPAYTRVAPPLVNYNYVRRPPPIQYVDHQPVQYVSRAIEQPVQYVQRPVVQPVQYIQRPLPPPVQYVERPVTRQIRYIQQRPVVKPIEYVEPRVVVEEPIIERQRYQIEGNLTPMEVGPSTVHVKYSNVGTNYDVMPTMNDVREVKSYETQQMNLGNSYTPYILGKNGASQMLEDRYLGKSTGHYMTNGYDYEYRNGYRGTSKELDHVLYYGNGKMKEVYDNSDWNNNYGKSRIIR